MKIKLSVLVCLLTNMHLNSQSSDLYLKRGEKHIMQSAKETFSNVVMEDKSEIIIPAKFRNIEIHMGKAKIGNDCVIRGEVIHGQHGSTPSKPSQSSQGENGKDGMIGGKGENGLKGCNITLVIGIETIGSIIFISHGGNGGKGATGGRGGDAGATDCLIGATKGGNGGNGGNGGDGGDGGDLTVIYEFLNKKNKVDIKSLDVNILSKQLENMFKPDLEPGYGEEGGERGIGGLGSAEKDCGPINIGGGANGDFGKNGNRGKPSGKWGTESYIRI